MSNIKSKNTSILESFILFGSNLIAMMNFHSKQIDPTRLTRFRRAFLPCQVGVLALAMLAIRQHELDLMMIKSSSLFLSYSRSKLTHSLIAT